MTIAGIEGHHDWTPPSALAPVIRLGNVRDDEGNREWPRYKLKAVQGLFSLGEAEDNRDAPPGMPGELVRLSWERGKTVTYEGWIQARTLLSLREADAALRAAFAERQLEGRMDVSWHPLNAEFAGELPKYFTARPLGVEIIDVQDTQLYERRFLVALRMGDQRYFDESTFAHSRTITITNVLHHIV